MMLIFYDTLDFVRRMYLVIRILARCTGKVHDGAKKTAASWLPAMGLSLGASKRHFDQAAVAIDLSQDVAN